MKKLELLKNSLVGKELNFGEIENMIESVFAISYEDSFYYEDNKYYAFENMNIDYAVNENESLRIEFEVNTEEDFDIYEDIVIDGVDERELIPIISKVDKYETFIKNLYIFINMHVYTAMWDIWRFPLQMQFSAKRVFSTAQVP